MHLYTTTGPGHRCKILLSWSAAASEARRRFGFGWTWMSTKAASRFACRRTPWTVAVARCALTTLAATAVVAEQSWPQFRGPRGDGTSSARDVPLNSSETNNLVWKVPVPGRRRSSPIVLEDCIWLTTALER